MGGSGVIPGWKVRRELARLGQQLQAIPEALWEPFAQARHDAAFAKGFPLVQGRQEPGARIALVLCWQPQGLAQSLVEMCTHLVAQDYAPLVVTNAPLSAADQARLLPVAWQILTRPNFGYDFGGYRDGLRHLWRLGLAPQRLVILNDSIWFPLRQDDDTLARMESSPADIVGTVLRERGDERFLESYFYSIRGEVLSNPAFRAFWDGLRLTSNKYKVIRRGERGFSAAMREAGLQLEGLFTVEDFLSRVETCTAEEMRAILAYAAFVDPVLAREAAALAADADDPRPGGLALMRRILGKAQFYSAFPVAAVRLLGYPVLKKSREPVSGLWRETWLRAVEEGILAPPSTPALNEIRTLRRIDGPTRATARG